MINPNKLLAKLAELDIVLSVSDGQLKYDAPEGVVTDGLLAEIKSHKEIILSWLSTTPDDMTGFSKTPTPRHKHQRIPLSNEQRRMWFLAALEGEGSYAYNMPPVVLRLTGNLNIRALEHAFSRLVGKHEILRTAFSSDNEGPFQCVRAPAPVSIPVEPGNTQSVEQVIAAEAVQPFALESGDPLFRIRLLKISALEYIFCFTIHHIICDGWSIGILVNELATSYESYDPDFKFDAPALPIQYGDFAIWQAKWLRQADAGKSRQFWKKSLENSIPTLDLPFDLIRNESPNFRGITCYTALEFDLTNQIKKFCRREGLTEFIFLLTAFYVLLARFTGQRDIIIGVPVSVRPSAILEDLVGLFLNTIPIRIDCDSVDKSLLITEHVRKIFIDAFEHRQLPLDEIIKAAEFERSGAQASLFQSLFALQNAPLQQAELGSIEITPVKTANVNAVLDLIMSIEETGGAFEVKIRGASQLFEKSSLERLLSQYREIVVELLDAPLSINGLDRAFDIKTSGACVPKTILKPSDSIVDRFDKIVKRHGTCVALRFEDQVLTYDEMSDKVNRLYGRIRQFIGQNGDPVAVFLPRSADLVIGIMAILKAGGSYVPLDPDSSSERIGRILEDCGASAVLTNADSGFIPIIPREIENIDLTTDSSDVFESLDPVRVKSSDLAYIIYTSGSTGKPKGVQVNHGNVLRLIDATDSFYSFGSYDHWTLFHSPAFDFSVWEIFGSLLTGGTLSVIPWEVTRDPAKFYRFVSENEVTVLNQTPSAFRGFDHEDERSPMPLRLRWVIFGGESLDFSALKAWVGRHGSQTPKFVNMYGITETTVHTTVRPISSDDLDRPLKSRIGVPLDDLGVAIVNSSMNPVMPGAVGEIIVWGGGVTQGYLNRPELNASKFPLAATFSGLSALDIKGRIYRSGDLGRWARDRDLEYCGRVDDQIKLHGYRIEPGEIESALNSHPNIIQSLVMIWKDEHDLPGLIAYIRMEKDQQLFSDEIRTYLGSKLPKYMCPSWFVQVNRFPLTINGKIDRKNLPSPTNDVIPIKRVRIDGSHEDDLLVTIRSVWEEILGISHIKEVDDFFELGGDSIRAALAVNRLQESLGQVLYVAGVFEHSVLDDYVGYIQRQYRSEFSSHKVVERDFEKFEKIIDQSVNRFGVSGQKNPAAMFVLSPPRSGSTLLRVLLGGHPKIFSPPELELLRFRTLKTRTSGFSQATAFYLEGLVRALMELRNWSADEALDWVKHAEELDTSTQDVFRELQQFCDGKLLVDKTPSYALENETLERIENSFDSPFYIHLYRHPCGMINSFKKAHLDQIFFRHDHGLSPSQLAEVIWTISHQNILHQLSGIPQSRQVCISFEQLVRNPEFELRKVCRMVGVDFKREMLDLYRDSKSRMTDGLRAESRMIGDVRFHEHRQIDASIADSWKEEWSLDDLSSRAKGTWFTLNRDNENFAPSSAKFNLDKRDRWVPSFSQERLWFLDQLEGSSKAYTIPGAISLSGGLNVEALEKAVSNLMSRHEVLKARFVNESGSVQIDVSKCHESFKILDLSRVSTQEQEARLRVLKQENIDHVFDLSEGTLFRVLLVKLELEKSILLINLHHAICDGWSLDILFSELATLYNIETNDQVKPLPALTNSFGEYTVWQRQETSTDRYQKQLAYWRNQLEGLPAEINLPFDFPRSDVQTFVGERVEISFDEALSQKIHRYCRDRSCTAFMFLLANFSLMLKHVSGDSDFAVGTPVAGRTRREHEGLVGFFANTLVLRICQTGQRFPEFLSHVKQVCLEGLSNQDVPFEQVVSALQPERNRALSPLFQVLFSLQRQSNRNLEFDGLSAELQESDIETAKFDLSLLLEDDGLSIKGTFEFNSDLFSKRSVEFIRDHFCEVTRQNVIEIQGNRPLEFIGHSERAFILSRAEGQVLQSNVATLWDWINRGIEQSDRTSTAISCNSGRLEYRELAAAIGSASSCLFGRGIRAGDRVAVLMNRDLNLVPWLIGIVKIGACYIPLDPNFPDDRISFILDDASAVAVISSPNHDHRECLRGRTRISSILDSNDSFSPVPFETPKPNAVAYICYTSGSTGRPKGVAVNQRAVVNLLESMRDLLNVRGSDCWAATTTISFDIHIPELFLLLGIGGEVFLVDDGSSKDPVALQNILDRSGISFFQATPSMWRALQIAGWKGNRSIVGISGGEKINPELAKFFSTNLKGFWNMYGPTETTVWSSAQSLNGFFKNKAATVPIGHPLHNTQLYIVNENCEILPVGVWGELAIGGHGVVDGYIDRPDLTAERFTQIAEVDDAAFVYLTGDRARLNSKGVFEVSGRIDNQIKVRGVRAEPEEIEFAIESITGVNRAVVSLKESVVGEDTLVAVVALSKDQHPQTIDSLTREVEGSLPSAMIPGRWILTDDLPLMPNGKVNRVKINELIDHHQDDSTQGTGSRSQGGRDLTEVRLLGLWRELLDNSQIQVDDNFFRSGGHSLLAVRLLSAIKNEFGVQLPLAAFFEMPTIRLMASRLRTEGISDQRQGNSVILQKSSGNHFLFLLPGAGGNLIYFQDLLRHLPSDIDVIGLQPPGLDGSCDPVGSIQELATVFLREILERGGDSHPKMTIAGHSFGGLVAYQIACDAERRGEPLSGVSIIDSASPDLHVPLGNDWSQAEWVVHMSSIASHMFQEDVDVHLSEIDRLPDEEQLSFFFERLLAKKIMAEGTDIAFIAGLVGVYRSNLMAKQTIDRLPHGTIPLRVIRSESEQPSHLLEERTRKNREQEDLGWARYLGFSVDVKRCSGDHLTMMQGKNAADLAKVILL
jgi:amino acid adenylation domain-containing protein